METQKTVNFQKIMYRKKEKDEGLLLGVRPWRWTLKKQYSPCFARDMETNEFVSELSPHRSNFSVYIPRKSLRKGGKYHIFRKEYMKDIESYIITITEIFSNGLQFVVDDV